MPTYKVYIAQKRLEEGSITIEAANVQEAIAHAQTIDLGDVDNWEDCDEVSQPWITHIMSDGEGLTLDDDDAGEGAVPQVGDE